MTSFGSLPQAVRALTRTPPLQSKLLQPTQVPPVQGRAGQQAPVVRHKKPHGHGVDMGTGKMEAAAARQARTPRAQGCQGCRRGGGGGS